MQNPEVQVFDSTLPLLNLVVFASGRGTNFEAIMKAVYAKRLRARVLGLVCNNPRALAVQRAKRYGVSVAIVDHRDYADRAGFEAEINRATESFGPVDLLVLAGWMRIFSPQFVDRYSGRILNLHPSLLPSFKGNHAVRQTLAAGVKFSGCTVHVVEAEVDSGEILVQAVVPVYPNDTEDELLARIQRQEHKALVTGIILYATRILAPAGPT